MAKRTLEVQLVGDPKSFVRALGKSGAAVDKFGRQTRSSFTGVAASAAKLAVATSGIAGVGVAFYKAGQQTIDFDKSMRNVNSLAQLSERNLKGLEKQVLSLAGRTAQAPKSLADGLYDLVSSGFNAKQSMLILQSSAKAATAGLTTTEVSTKAVAAVLNAYHRPASDAAAISDTLFQTVNKGVISFEQLSNTIGDVLPFASSLGINLKEVGAASATLTKAGISPEETMTRLKNVMVKLLKPGDDLAAAIKKTGHESGESLVKAKGFQGSLEALLATTDGSKAAVAKLFPDIRALGGALALTGKNANGAEADLASFQDVTGATDKALSQQSKSIAYRWNKIKAVFSSLAIQGGSVLIPVMGSVLDSVGAAVSKVKDLAGEFNHLRTGKGSGPKPLTLGINGDPAAEAKGTLGALGSMIKQGVQSIDWNAIGNTMSDGLNKGLNIARKIAPGVQAGIAAAFSNVDGEAVLQGLVTILAQAIKALFSPSFWIHNFGAILSTVVIVIPLGKILKIPGMGFLFNKISKPLFDVFRKALGFVASNLVSGFKAVASAGVSGFARGVIAQAPEAAGAALRLAIRVTHSLAGLPGKLLGLGSRAGGGLVSGLGSLAGKLGGVAGRLAGRVLSPVAGLAGKMLEIGKNIVSGLIRGIASKAGDILSTVKNFIIDKIPGPIKRFLKMHSPSLVMQEIGVNIGRGLANGIRASAGIVSDAVRTGLLFPLDAAIAELTAKKDALQSSFDKADSSRERARLVTAVQEAGGSGGGGNGVGLDWAKRMVGKFAESTGSNTGPGLDKLQREFGTHAAAWCAEFATKALIQAGAPKELKSASVAQLRGWAQAGTHGLQKGVRSTGRAGDLMAFGNNHIGVVEKIVNGVVHTIEGNTSAGKVARRTHAMGSGDFFRPEFSGGSVPSSGHIRSAGAATGKGMTRTSFAEALLRALGIKATPANLKAVIGWEGAEGGHWGNDAKFNPLNTTQKAPGAKSMNSHGVKSYKSWTQGLDATVKTLKNGKYGPILAALRSGDPMDLATALGKTPWGTGAGLVRSAISGAKVGARGTGGVDTSQVERQITANEDKLDALREKKRNLSAGKSDRARRKALSDEIAGIVTRNRKLRATLKNEKAAGSQQSELADAMQALKDFDNQTARTKRMSKIDVQIRGLEQVRAFKGAISDLRTSIADRLTEAADKFRTTWENTTGKAIDAANAAMLKGFDATTDAIIARTAAARELAGLRATDDALSRSQEDASNAKTLADAQYLVAHSGGQAHKDALLALADAEAAIEATKRKRREDELEATVAAETASIQESRAVERATLEENLANARDARLADDVANFTNAEKEKLDILTSSLEAQRLTYKDYVGKVNALLASIGVSGIDASADQEAVVNGGRGSTTKAPAKAPSYGAFKRPRRAQGGRIDPGMIYRTGELGPENIGVDASGRLRVSQASESRRSGGGNAYLTQYGDVRIGSQKAAEVAVNRLAHRLAFG